MSARPPVFATSPTNPSLGEIQTEPARKPDMPYAPAIRVEAPGDLLFISGATPSPLYHKHPHELHEHNHPVGIADQTRLAMENIKTILDHRGWYPLSPLYPLAHLGMGRAAAMNADNISARKFYEEFFKYWAEADSTIPILIQARAEYEKLK